MCGGTVRGDARRYSRADLELVALYGAIRGLGLPIEQGTFGGTFEGREVLAVVSEASEAADSALAEFDERRGAALGFSAEQLSGTRGEDALGREGKLSASELEALDRDIAQARERGVGDRARERMAAEPELYERLADDPPRTHFPHGGR